MAIVLDAARYVTGGIVLDAARFVSPGGIVIDSAPASVVRGQVGVTVTASGYSAGATLANTAARIGGVSGQLLAVTDVNYNDADTITFTLTVGDVALQYGDHAIYVDANGEVVQTAAISFTPAAGKGFVALNNPDNGTQSIGAQLTDGGGAQADLVTGQQIEYDTASTPGGYAVSIDETGFITIDVQGNNTAQTFQARVIDNDGVLGGLGTATFAEVGADVTPPVFLSGPTVSNITQTDFNVSATSNETGTGSMIVTATGAVQPSDAAFDAVALSVTANVSSLFVASGLPSDTDLVAWVQLVDLAGNRTTDFVNARTAGVTDTIAPIVTAPADTTIQYPIGAAGLAHNDPALGAWLSAASATDETAPANPVVTNNIALLPDPIPAGAPTVTFFAQDAAGNAGQDTAVLTVQEETSSGVAPSISDQQFFVAENVPVGEAIGTVVAQSTIGAITYTILSGNTGNALSLNPSTGELTAATALDYQTVNAYTLTVRATAGGFSADAAITVYVQITTDHDLVNLDAFFPAVRAEIPSVATALLTYHAREAVIEFCKRSRYWQQELPPLIVMPDMSRYGVNPPSGTVISAFVAVKTIDDQGNVVDLDRTNQDLQRWAFYQISNTVIAFQHVEEFAPGPVDITVALIPAPDTLQVSQDIYHQYHETIVSGIKSRLFSMHGQTWTDAQRAIDSGYVFEEGVNNALAEAARGYSDLPEPIARKPRDYF